MDIHHTIVNTWKDANMLLHVVCIIYWLCDYSSHGTSINAVKVGPDTVQ